jgi:hypothetical protein
VPKVGWLIYDIDQDAYYKFDGAPAYWVEFSSGGGGGAGGRELLTAPRTYYVRTDGSDSNNGLSNSAGGAFLTIQKAIDTVATLDLSIYDATIQIGPGTYAASVQLKSLVGAGKAIILGDETTPANVAISTTSADAIWSNLIRGTWALRGLKIQTTTSGRGIAVQGRGCVVEIQNLDFGACASQHMNARSGAHILQTGNYAISGGSAFHWNAIGGGTIECQNHTITLTGTPAFGSAFAIAQITAVILAASTTFSGAATGVRYSALTNAVIYTGGGGANYLAGNAAGATASGGQYV